MIKAIPSKEEMKFLIKRIFETSSKLQGNIKINSLDDAANVASYIYGFSSWKEYQNLHKIEYEDKKTEEFPIKLPKFKPQSFKKQNIFIDSINANHIVSEPTLKNSSILPLEWLIGKKRNVMNKVEEPIGLLTENHIITSAPILGASTLLENQIKWLIKHQQTFILFGLNNNISNSNFIDLWQKEKVLQIGKNGFKIDPIEESFEGEGFEALLDIKPFGEHQAFPWVWAMMIRTFHDELNMKWTVDKLIESLQIENLLQLTEKIKNINPLVAKPLHQYLYKQCGVTYDDEQFFVSEEGQARHYHQIYLLQEKLQKLSSLYKLGYFSEATNVSIKKCVLEKISAVFLDCKEDNLNKYYWEICNATYINAIKKQNKLTTLLDSKNYKIWSIWWNAEDIISETIASELLENKETTILGFYILSSNHHLEKLFLDTRQVIFLKQYFNQYPQSWLNKALNDTEFWEENIWFNNYACAKDLSYNQAYVWKPKTTMVPQDLEYYELKKIEIYLKDPTEK